jgi:hypothetical protein
MVLLLLTIPLANVVVLSFYSQPSENDIEEKLRAVSPVSRPPDYFSQTVEYADSLLTAGNDMLLDARNYNDRLLYLSLYQHRSRLYEEWKNNDHLAAFVRDERPNIVIYTEYPSVNHPLFRFVPNSHLVRVAGVMYEKSYQSGIYSLLKHTD